MDIPYETKQLAIWFAEGVKTEITALEKNGGTQQYEVLSGKFLGLISPTQAIYEFIIADSTRIPEDANGKLKTEAHEYPAYIVSQFSNRIHIQIESSEIPDSGIQRAILKIDDTLILKKLVEALDSISENPSAIGSLTTAVFHADQQSVGILKLPLNVLDVKDQT